MLNSSDEKNMVTVMTPEITINHFEKQEIECGPGIDTMIAEGGIDFFQYLKSHGMAREANLLVLSSKHHYFYDHDDMKSVRILVNLKKLNRIRNLDMFLNSLVHILPSDASFIGYFSDDKADKNNPFQFNWLLRGFNRFENLLDPGTDKLMDKDEVSEVLKKNGFNVVDMTEMNGHTYFYSHYTRQQPGMN